MTVLTVMTNLKMYNKITSHDNKEITIEGCHLMMYDIRFQVNRQMCNNTRFLRLNSKFNTKKETTEKFV